jgi:hypothetical protein
VRIPCPRCRRDVAGADIDVHARMAVCRPCGEVIPLAPPPPPPFASAALAVGPPPMELAAYKPTTLRWDETRSVDAFVARTAPSRLASVPMAAFALVWDTFLIGWYALAIVMASRADATAPMLMMFVFPLLHVGAGVWITYRAAVGLFNTTTIALRGGTLRITRGPIPERGDVNEAIEVVEGLAVVDAVSRKRPVSQVDVRTTDRRTIKGLTFSDPLAAAFACERLNQVLVEVKTARDRPYR